MPDPGLGPRLTRVHVTSIAALNQSGSNPMDNPFNDNSIPPPRPEVALSRAQANAPKFASESGRVASLSSSHCLFRLSASGAPHVMTLQVLQALALCGEFRSLDEHVSRIESTVSGLVGKHEAIRRVLEDLIKRRLLLSDEDFISRLSRAPRRDPPAMRAVFIRACDRPDRLAHLLASLVHYERQYAARRRYVLIDDSVHAANVELHRDQLRQFELATRCEVRYVGQAESARLVERIARAVPQARDAAGHLLVRGAHAQAHRFGGGRSRNLALLLSAGSRLTLLDDDLILPLRRPDFARNGMDPHPEASAQPRFYPSMELALQSGSEVDEDPFEMHLQLCGHSLGASVGGRYELSRDELHGLTLDQLRMFAADTRIATTHHGSYGSSRSESTLWLYQISDPVAREQFWGDHESYQRNRGAHHLYYGAGRAHTHEFSGFTPFALDNSELLPCTNPVGRAEDSLGNALIHYCQPESVAVELPVAIGHVQESQRKRFRNTDAASVPRVNDFLREFVRRQFGSSRADDPAQRLDFLSHVLRDLSHARVGDRLDSLREFRSLVYSGIVEGLQRQLEKATEAPDYWREDVRAIVQVNTNELLDAGAAPRLAEWPQDIDTSACARALGAELESMADACEHWPVLWQYAAAQGNDLLVSI
jgi:hypothetical protein